MSSQQNGKKNRTSKTNKKEEEQKEKEKIMWQASLEPFQNYIHVVLR